MAKPNILMLLMAATVLLAHSSGYRLGKTTTLNTENPFLIGFLPDSAFFGIVSQNKSHYIIDQINEQSVNREKTCAISMDPVSETITGRLRATTLYKKIVVWGKRSEEIVHNGKFRRTTYTVLLIDYNRCTHYSFPNLVDKVPTFYPDILPEIMAHQDSFDIFFPSQETCSPCSFDINGGKKAAPNQLKHQGVPKARFFLREIGRTNTYAYLYNFDNGTAVVKLLDRKYKDAYPTTLNINTMVQEFATNFMYDGSERIYIGLIYTLPESPRQPTLLVFNETLSNLVHSATIPLRDYYNLIDASLAIDRKGQAYVTTMQQSDKSRIVDLVVYNEKGRISKDANIFELPLNGNRKIQNYVNNWYQFHCVAAHEFSPQHITDINCAEID